MKTPRLKNHRYGWPANGRSGFTLIEILVVLAIIGILMTMLGATVTNTIRKARETATISLLQKIDGLLDDRIKGFDRATKSRDFQRVVALRKQALEQAGLFGVSPKVIEAVARKDFFRQNFPQRFDDLAPNSCTAIAAPVLPTVIVSDAAVAAAYNSANHKRETESAALLYFMLTKMQVFGLAPVAEAEFTTSEVRDTDNDGLLEFVDGWGRPLRFYRWPTRLLKPNGAVGQDNAYSGGSFASYGTLGSDDVVVPVAQRSLVGMLIDGLPRAPVVAGQWDSLSEDPDDPYGLITTELKRLFAQYGATVLTGYQEPAYPTLDTYHTPLIVSVGGDGELGLYEPYEVTDNGDGVLTSADTNMGILAQPKYGSAGPYDAVLNPLTDNLTNRNRRAGRGK